MNSYFYLWCHIILYDFLIHSHPDNYTVAFIFTDAYIIYIDLPKYKNNQ